MSILAKLEQWLHQDDAGASTKVNPIIPSDELKPILAMIKAMHTLIECSSNEGFGSSMGGSTLLTWVLGPH